MRMELGGPPSLPSLKADRTPFTAAMLGHKTEDRKSAVRGVVLQDGKAWILDSMSSKYLPPELSGEKSAYLLCEH